MCEERLALFHRYHTLTMEHAKRVSEFSALADQSPADAGLNGQLETSLKEIESSRQAVHEARQKLTQHYIEHRCDQFPNTVRQSIVENDV